MRVNSSSCNALSCLKYCVHLICFSEQSQVTGISQAAFESTEAVVQPGERHVQ